LSIITPAIKAALMYKNRSIKQKKSCRKNPKTTRNKKHGAKNTAKDTASIKKAEEEGVFRGQGMGRPKWRKQVHRPKTTTAEAAKSPDECRGPRLGTHTATDIWLWCGMGWHGMV